MPCAATCRVSVLHGLIKTHTSYFFRSYGIPTSTVCCTREPSRSKFAQPYSLCIRIPGTWRRATPSGNGERIQNSVVNQHIRRLLDRLTSRQTAATLRTPTPACEHSNNRVSIILWWEPAGGWSQRCWFRVRQQTRR